MKQNSLFISIIVPVYNDSTRLNRCLSALKSQSYPPHLFEVIVVDNGSRDDVKTVVKKYNYRLIHEEYPGSYAARNTGIRYSKGDIIGFTDSDCIPDKKWIEIAAQYFKRNQDCSSLCGRINLINNNNQNKKLALLFYDQIYHFNQQNFSKNKNFAATANFFCKRAVFDIAGLFDITFYSFGDVEFGERIKSKGFTIDYYEQLEVKHPQIKNYRALWKRSKRLAGGGRQLRKKKGYDNFDELNYILLSIIGTPFIMLCRLLYDDIPSFRQRILFAWASLIVHISKCHELISLIIKQKEPERQ